ncbi:hypothetical protein CAEBREN_13606 [Caenorhabditis brenneri]|uniref:Sdz-33 F-box domain-containing protein n=1 Tax=Caenorhabditis brenneri TaxID=135651 RepID=G0PAL0_CAEBE|nr:hypothetical protein CAEBREN_13606 [Caenorhabditis brenneri]
MTVSFFKEILTEPALNNFDLLCIENGEIDAECLDLVMGMANSDRDLHISSKTKFPHNYYHDNAFKFRHIYYSDARPVRIEHLLSLKNAYSIRLDTHRLTSSDLNTFIKCWIDSDHDMVGLLWLDKWWLFEPEILFNGIVVLVGQRTGLNGWYLIAANPTKQRRERLIMAVIWLGDKIHLYSWDKDLPMFEDAPIEPWAPEYKVLMAMNKKKELERELEEKVNTIEKKNEITRELQNVSQELDSYNLEFREGFITSDRISPDNWQILKIDKYPTPFQNCLSIFKHLQNIISFKSRYIDVDLEGMTLRSLKEILTEPVLRNFDLLRLDKGEIDAKCLDLVMEMANSNIDLHIMSGTKIPFNYHHENAFKFRDSFYSDARQYRLEHLLRLKDAYSVRLGMHRLTHYDVNTFIKFWIKSDHDMVDLLGLDMKEFRPEILFDGIVVLIGQRMGHACFYLM